VLASQPDFYLPQFAMGSALFQQQNYAEAFGFLHKAIELEPESPWAHYMMGIGLMKAGDFQTSDIHLKIAARRLPGFVPLRVPLAEVERHLSTSQGAVRKEGTGKHD
jgi:tetratricopeptide (TPR) repeat protein